VPCGLCIEVDVADTRVVVRLAGVLDTVSSPFLAVALKDCHRDVDIDVAGIAFMDCAGYSVLADLAAAIVSGERLLRLTGVARPVGRLLDILGTPEHVTLT
jgi:anti-anti-sigma factor